MSCEISQHDIFSDTFDDLPSNVLIQHGPFLDETQKQIIKLGLNKKISHDQVFLVLTDLTNKIGFVKIGKNYTLPMCTKEMYQTYLDFIYSVVDGKNQIICKANQFNGKLKRCYIHVKSTIQYMNYIPLHYLERTLLDKSDKIKLLNISLREIVKLGESLKLGNHTVERLGLSDLLYDVTFTLYK